MLTNFLFLFFLPRDTKEPQTGLDPAVTSSRGTCRFTQWPTSPSQMRRYVPGETHRAAICAMASAVLHG